MDFFYVRGNALASARNIATHEFLFRLTIVSDLVVGTGWLLVIFTLYTLLHSVDRAQAILMVILGGILQVLFAGLWLFPLGILVYTSTFLPRWLGVWLFLAGFSWIATSVSAFLTPQYSGIIDKISTPLTCAEIVLMAWLPILGARPGFFTRRTVQWT